MKLIFAVLTVCVLLMAPAAAFRFGGTANPNPPPQSIVSVTVSPTSPSYTGGSGSANTVVATVTVTMSAPPIFSGTLALTGPNAGSYKLVGNTITACAAPQTPCGDVAAPASHSISVVATQSGASGSPFTSAPVTINVTSPAAVAFLSTQTVKNTSGSTVANWPLQRAMAFKSGQVASNEHVEIRVASGTSCTGTLLDHQWDDIARRTENTGDGSWRTATFTVRLPSTTASSYATIAFCKVPGAYSPATSSITLADLVAAHPLVMDFIGVENQDGSTRDSGSATMAIADYITTTGREAPILTADGPVRKSWKIRGEPVYATSGNKEPLLYVEWYIDVFTNPAAPSTIQYVKHLTRVSNAWMQVAAGTAGVATATSCNGGACPAGFANDPQMVAYQPRIRDGATVLVDYGATFDNTVTDPTLPANSVTYQTNASTSIGGNVLRFTGDAINGGQPPLAGVWYHTRVSNLDHPSSIPPTDCQVTDPDINVTGYQISCVVASPGVSSGDRIKFDTYFTKPDNILGPFTISAMSWASSFGGELTLTTSATGVTTGNNTRLMIVGATNSGTGGNAAINTVFTEWEGNTNGTSWGVQAQAAAGVFGTLGFGSAQVYIAAPGAFTDDDQKTGYFQSNGSVGNHLYYPGSCFKYTTGGTPPAPLINGKIYYPYTINFFKQPNNGDRFQLTEAPINRLPITPINVGSGSQTLSYRVCHRKQTAWFTANFEGKSRWIGAAAETEPFETTLDQNSPYVSERAYFQQTGVIPPLELSHAATWATTTYSEVEYSASTAQYYPCSVSLAIGGSGGGSHGYIGIMSEWNARWWLSQDLNQIKQSRIFALDGECYPQTVILNEQTGRIPVINNGAPVGTGSGTGTPYAGLGNAVYPNLNIPLDAFGASSYINVTYPRVGVPAVSGGDPIKSILGPYQGGIYNDHQPAFAFLPPFVFGDRHYQDIIWDQGNRSGYIATDRSPNNTNERGPNRTFTFPSASGTPPAGQTFRGILTFGNTDQQGPRGGAWMQRAVTMAAALGADGGAERGYFFDLTKEHNNFWQAMKAHKDCSSPQDAATSPYTAVPGGWSNSPAGTLQQSSNQAFMNMYNSMARYLGWQLLRDPYSREQLDGAFFQNVKASLGTTGWPDSTPPSMSAGFFYYQWGDLRKAPGGKCRAPYAGTYLDYGSSSIFVGIDVSNGIWMMAGNDQGLLGPVGVTMTAGDKIKNVHIGDQAQAAVENPSTGGPQLNPVLLYGPSEMPYDTYYCMVNINNTDRTFKVAPPNPTCATPGAAINSFSGMVAEGENYCFAPPAWSAGELPPSMNSATTWFCGFAYNFRTQANDFIGNPGYVYWNGSLAAAVAASGVPAAVASYNISRAYMPVTDILSNSVGSAFDWGVSTIPP